MWREKGVVIKKVFHQTVKIMYSSLIHQANGLLFRDYLERITWSIVSTIRKSFSLMQFWDPRGAELSATPAEILPYINQCERVWFWRAFKPCKQEEEKQIEMWGAKVSHPCVRRWIPWQMEPRPLCWSWLCSYPCLQYESLLRDRCLHFWSTSKTEFEFKNNFAGWNLM